MTLGLIIAAGVLAGVKVLQARGQDIVAWAVLVLAVALAYRF